MKNFKLAFWKLEIPATIRDSISKNNEDANDEKTKQVLMRLSPTSCLYEMFIGVQHET